MTIHNTSHSVTPHPNLQNQTFAAKPTRAAGPMAQEDPNGKESPDPASARMFPKFAVTRGNGAIGAGKGEALLFIQQDKAHYRCCRTEVFSARNPSLYCGSSEVFAHLE
jgi:hypothetical protein